MSNLQQDMINWLQDIGETIPTSKNANNLLETPVKPMKRSKPTKNKTSTVTISPSTREELKKIKSLDALKTMMASFEGCDLKKLAKNMVFGDGNPESKVMLIGEAPGAEEDIQGLPFVGASGKLLDLMFSYIGLDRTNFFITNIIPWRPPGNRNPTSDEITTCLPFVEKRIELIKPKIIIMVGGVSAKSLLDTSTGIMRLRGQWHKYQCPTLETPIDAFAIFHPSYLLRSPGQKRMAWRDLLMIKQKLREEKIL